MLVPASNPSEQEEKVRKAKQCLVAAIRQQNHEQTIFLSNVNAKMHSLLVDMTRKVWGKYCNDRYGWNPLQHYKFFYISLKIQNNDVQVSKQSTTFDDFTNRVKRYFENPTVATQPIIYKHNIPRSTPELLYFDSPSSLFYFAGARGYSLRIDKKYDMTIGTEKESQLVTDGRRITIAEDNRKKKVFRRGLTEKEVLPSYLCDNSNMGNMSVVDYRSFFKQNLIDTIRTLEKFMETIPVYIDAFSPNGFLRECLSYLPYLMTVLLINIESDNFRLASSIEKYCTQREWEASLFSAFSIQKSLVTHAFSSAHLHYLSLWTDYLKNNGATLAEKYEIEKEFATYVTSISKAANLNMLVSDIPSNQERLNLLEYLYDCPDPFEREHTTVYFEDLLDDDYGLHGFVIDFHSGLCKITAPEYYTLPLHF